MSDHVRYRKGRIHQNRAARTVRWYQQTFGASAPLVLSLDSHYNANAGQLHAAQRLGSCVRQAPFIAVGREAGR